jgi:hypothetical protein
MPKKMADMEDGKKLVLGIVIISVTLIIAIYILATLQGNFRAEGTSGSIVNESITPTTAGTNFAVVNLLDVSCGTITKVYNTTNNVIINSGNYTQTGCKIANKTSTYPVGAWKVTYAYTYTSDTIASNASGNLTSSLNDATPWITILIVVGFAVIVLGFLTSGFKGVENQNAATVY